MTIAISIVVLAALLAVAFVIARRKSDQEQPTTLARSQASRAEVASFFAGEDFATVAADSGFFVSPIPKWLVEAGDAALQDKSASVREAERSIRQTGEPLTADDKRALGISGGGKFGKDFIEALSPAGLEKPSAPLLTCLMRCSHARSVRRSVEQARAAGMTVVELMASNDDGTCAAGRAANGEKFPIADAPALPLHGCDAPWCRCTFVASAD